MIETRRLKNVVIFIQRILSFVLSRKIRKKDILILGKGATQGLEHTLIAEKMYSINFTEHNSSEEFTKVLFKFAS